MFSLSLNHLPTFNPLRPSAVYIFSHLQFLPFWWLQLQFSPSIQNVLLKYPSNSSIPKQLSSISNIYSCIFSCPPPLPLPLFLFHPHFLLLCNGLLSFSVFILLWSSPHAIVSYLHQKQRSDSLINIREWGRGSKGTTF